MNFYHHPSQKSPKQHFSHKKSKHLFLNIQKASYFGIVSIGSVIFMSFFFSSRGRFLYRNRIQKSEIGSHTLRQFFLQEEGMVRVPFFNHKDEPISHQKDEKTKVSIVSISSESSKFCEERHESETSLDKIWTLYRVQSGDTLNKILTQWEWSPQEQHLFGNALKTVLSLKTLIPQDVIAFRKENKNLWVVIGTKTQCVILKKKIINVLDDASLKKNSWQLKREKLIPQQLNIKHENSKWFDFLNTINICDENILIHLEKKSKKTPDLPDDSVVIQTKDHHPLKMIQKKNVSKLLKKEDVSKSLGLHIQKTIEKENISKTLALHIQKTIEKEENLPLKDKQEKVSQNISFQCEKAPIALGSYRISSGYCSGRRHPVLGYVRAHRGIDFSARRGTSVSCVSPGRIKDILWNSSGFGLHVVVSHKNKIDTLYGHLSQFSKKIHKGKEIKAGEEIGCVGSSGLATGAHLHFEIRNQGIPQDPTPYLSRVIPNLSYKKNKNKIS